LSKEAAFIIPYFGKFNNYFQLFLNSCRYNKKFDWLIFTDDKRPFNFPDNVIVTYTTFEETKKLFQSKFDFPIALNKPYKLCDFKVAYGFIYSQHLKHYNFWGHCDVDLIFGNLSEFITEKDYLLYDKIGILGHCTLYRNNAEINTLFLKPLNGYERGKYVLQSEENQSFDEEFKLSINNIFEQYKKKIRYDEYEANIYTKSSNFKITKLNIENKKYVVEPKTNSFFLWNEGLLKRYTFIKGNLLEKEYMYLHMQSRPMKIKGQINELNNKFKIIPNTFEALEVSEINSKTFSEIRIKYFNFHYFILRTKNLIKKIKRRILCH